MEQNITNTNYEHIMTITTNQTWLKCLTLWCRSIQLCNLFFWTTERNKCRTDLSRASKESSDHPLWETNLFHRQNSLARDPQQSEVKKNKKKIPAKWEKFKKPSNPGNLRKPRIFVWPENQEYWSDQLRNFTRHKLNLELSLVKFLSHSDHYSWFSGQMKMLKFGIYLCISGQKQHDKSKIHKYMPNFNIFIWPENQE